MHKEIDLRLPPEAAADEALIRVAALQKTGMSDMGNVLVKTLKRSVDARGRQILINLKIGVFLNEAPPKVNNIKSSYQFVHNAPPAIIVGAGPAGLFAALRLISLGIKPIVLERGKDVRGRRRDLADINKKHIVNPESNYCFGEGGAGTYSDGKLYTRSKKRGDIRRILEALVNHGATEDILVDAHPHIGTNKLPKIVEALRESIIEAGGEVHFNAKVTELIVRSQKACGVVLSGGEKIEGLGVILATGHSARDVFYMLQRQKIAIEAKPFALGVRVEHPQALIDKMQYRQSPRNPLLPASSYALVQQVNYGQVQRGVFSFCMCPGGFIVPAATAPGELVVNGMSPSRRDSRFANSGMVVAIELEDIPDYHQHGALAALMFQQAIEQHACHMAGGGQTAPAQRLTDFLQNKVSTSLPETSYQPGLLSMDMREVLPALVYKRLQEGFKAFDNKMKGYVTAEAQLVGIESRTSSPVKIPRDRETLEHPEVRQLYPCGEGAGYAGGIVSAAMDGERCAERLAASILHV